MSETEKKREENEVKKRKQIKVKMSMQRIRELSRETFSMGGDVRYVSVYVFNTLKRRTVWFMLPIAMAWPVCQPMRARENHTMSMETSHVHTHKRRERERERALTHRAGAYHIDGATVSSTMNNVKNAVYKRLAQAHTIRLSLNRNNTCISRMISAEYDVLYAFVPNQMDESCSIVCTNQVVQFFFLSFHPAAKIRKSENVMAARYEQNC